jgi:hypothetical protein
VLSILRVHHAQSLILFISEAPYHVPGGIGSGFWLIQADASRVQVLPPKAVAPDGGAGEVAEYERKTGDQRANNAPDAG